jgi:HEAT repeat protein
VPDHYDTTQTLSGLEPRLGGEAAPALTGYEPELGGERRLLADPHLFEAALRTTTHEMRRSLIAQAIGTGQARVLARQLAAIAHPEARRRLAGLPIGGYSKDQRVNALGVFRMLGEVVDIEPFVFAMWDRNEQIRALAAGALGDIAGWLSEDSPQGERIIHALLIALRHHDAQVRRAAAQGLAHFPETDVIDLLLDRLEREDDTDVLGQVARSLGALGDPCAVEPLLAAYRQDRLSREDCQTALVQIGKSAVETLVGFASRRNVSVSVRLAAIHALGLIGDLRALEPLRELDRRSNECLKIRFAVVSALIDLMSENSHALAASHTRCPSDVPLLLMPLPPLRLVAPLIERTLREWPRPLAPLSR